jgi:DNA adenine methylase
LIDSVQRYAEQSGMAQRIWEEDAAEGKAVALVPRPVLKWAGGKQQMLDVLLRAIPPNYTRYIEPFLGGGALFFALRPKEAIIADSNPELINLYRVIAADVEDLISALQEMQNDEETFYAIRATDSETLSPIEQAARTIYLNRTCFNGLYRVNRQGEFNVPYGRYKSITICDAPNLRAVSQALQRVEIVHGDYKDVLCAYARPGDLIYLDPPYLPISVYSDFKRYTKEQFFDILPIRLAGMGFHPRRRWVSCNARVRLPSLPCRFGLDLLSRRRTRDEPLGFGIARGVDIPVMHRTTGRTGPLPDR